MEHGGAAHNKTKPGGAQTTFSFFGGVLCLFYISTIPRRQGLWMMDDMKFWGDRLEENKGGTERRTGKEEGKGKHEEEVEVNWR